MLKLYFLENETLNAKILFHVFYTSLRVHKIINYLSIVY